MNNDAMGLTILGLLSWAGALLRSAIDRVELRSAGQVQEVHVTLVLVEDVADDVFL
jgi:hypothetical protein